jgi:hypothetical protein
VALVTTEVLGLPPELAPEFEAANRAIVRAMLSGLDPAAAGPGQQARETVNRLVADWAPRAGSGVLGALRTAPGTDALDLEQVASSVRVVLLSSINSTATLITLALRHLLRDDASAGAYPGAADPAVAVHELVRFDGPAQAAGRLCALDTLLEGQRVRAGDQVLVLLAAANRDPERFEAPEQLRLDRHPNPHLGFGRGAHHCIGTQLAITVGDAVLSTACRSRWRLARGGVVQFARNPALRSLDRLELARS